MSLNTTTRTLTFTLQDNSEGDLDNTVGVVKDPLIVGGGTVSSTPPPPPPPAPTPDPTFTPNPPNPDVIPIGVTITNTSTQIQYIGGWNYQLTQQGSVMWVSNIGGINPSSTITLNNITGFHWIADMGPRGSRAYVYVNGRYVGIVNLYSDTYRPDRTVFSATNLNPSETYTIQIVPLPTLPGFGINVNRFIVQ